MKVITVNAQVSTTFTNMYSSFKTLASAILANPVAFYAVWTDTASPPNYYINIVAIDFTNDIAVVLITGSFTSNPTPASLLSDFPGIIQLNNSISFSV